MSKKATGIFMLAAGLAAYFSFFRKAHLRWGASDEEVRKVLPGDELVPETGFVATHALTVDAPPECVYPWFLQLGQDKAGFYSYTALENLFGCQMKNTYELRREWLELRVGDSVLFHPKAPRVPVAILEENRVFCMGAPGESSWSMICEPLGERRTRLIIRLRSNVRSIGGRIFHLGFWEPAHFIMERKMMLTIKELAEELYERTRQDALAAGRPY